MSSAAVELNLTGELVEALHTTLMRIVDAGAECALLRAYSTEMLGAAERRREPGSALASRRGLIYRYALRDAQLGVHSLVPLDEEMLLDVAWELDELLRGRTRTRVRVETYPAR